MNTKFLWPLLIALSTTLFSPASFAFTATDLISLAGKAISSAQAGVAQINETSAPIPSDARIETGFSPNGQALGLVLRTIGSAAETLDVMAYSFTSAEVTRALLQAAKRGVRVRVLVDYQHNLVKDKSGKPISALSALATAGADIRTVSKYAIFHDKVIIADKRHLQTGSFNYSQSAAQRNSENVIVLWNANETASQYAMHFESRWRQGDKFSGR